MNNEINNITANMKRLVKLQTMSSMEIKKHKRRLKLLIYQFELF